MLSRSSCPTTVGIRRSNGCGDAVMRGRNAMEAADCPEQSKAPALLRRPLTTSRRRADTKLGEAAVVFRFKSQEALWLTTQASEAGRLVPERLQSRGTR